MKTAITFAITAFCLLAASAAAQDLRVFQTAHYRIHTDLDEDLSDDLGRRMDVMYNEYSRRLAQFTQSEDSKPLEVYLVHSREKYLHLVGLAMAGTGGAYNPVRKLLASFLDGQGRDALRRTLQHEAFHQFIARAIGPAIPIWLNEGLAQVFEEGVWTGDSFQLGEVPPRRLRELNHDISQSAMYDFPDFLKTTPLEWASRFRDSTQATIEYNQAWAMTHFLIYATDENGQPKYRSRLIEMLRLLRSGVDGEDAFRQAFSDNIAGFQNRFMEYAASLHPTPLATLIENQTVLGDLLVEFKSRGHAFDSLNEFRDVCVRQRWQLRYRRGNVQWETAENPIVYFQDSSGRPFSDDEQHFELAGERPMQDLACRAPGMPPLRTRFTDVDGKVEHETMVDEGSVISGNRF